MRILAKIVSPGAPVLLPPAGAGCSGADLSHSFAPSAVVDGWELLAITLAQMDVLRTLRFASILLALSLPRMEATTAEPPNPVSGRSTTLVEDASSTRSVQWINVKVPGQGTLLAAVVRPTGEGQFPAVIVLHRTHGFAREYVEIAQNLAQGGMIAVALCWFNGGTGTGLRFVHPIDCPGAPTVVAPASREAKERLDAAVETVRALPGVISDRIALFGHSRGGGAVLNYVFATDTIRAAVLESAGYPSDLAARASLLKTPVLILHGMHDNPNDGGTTLTDVRMAKNFDAAMRRAGKPVEAKYYEEGGHSSIFADPVQRKDEIHHMLDFLNRYLRK